MLVRDLRTGQLVDVPNRRIVSPGGSGFDGFAFSRRANALRASAGHGVGAYHGRPSQVIYDGLGNPVGILPFLAALKPLAAAILPTLASKAGALFKGAATAIPALAPQAPSPMPAVAPPAEAIVSPGPAMPPPMPLPAPGPMSPPAMMPSPTTPAPAATETTLPPSPAMPAPPAAAAPASAVQDEVVVAPIRVQTPSGGTVIVPVRIRRRRRARGRRVVRVMPRTMENVLPPPRVTEQYAPAPVTSRRQLQGWHGFGGWRGV